MPLIHIYTNLKNENFPLGFEERTTQYVSSVLNKHKEHITIMLFPDVRMCLNEDFSPCATIYIRAVDVFDRIQNPAVSRKFQEFFKINLGIPLSRINLVFIDHENSMVG